MDLPREFGAYTLLKRLAVGGMAEVYVAKARGIGGFEKLVAIKVIHPRLSEDQHFIQMLVEEAKLTVLLTHGNIAQTFDLNCIDETYCIVMEYVDGADTYRILRRCEARSVEVPIDICAYLMSEVMNGLDYAHRKRDGVGKPLNVVHRDVSPQNVLVSHTGEVKLVDFGIAKAALRTGQTEAGVIKGKYYYMSPEQAWGDNVDHRSDIFSAGVVLYELLTGKMVYQHDSIPALLDSVRKAEVVPPSVLRPEIPRALDRVVLRACAKRPEERYQSAHEMAQELSTFLYTVSASFTAQRLADFMDGLYVDEPKSGQRRAPAEPEAAPLVTGELPSMNRDDFAPRGESVIFDLGDVDVDVDVDGEEEQTRADVEPYVSRSDEETMELGALKPVSAQIPSADVPSDEPGDPHDDPDDDPDGDEATLIHNEFGDHWQATTSRGGRASNPWIDSTTVDVGTIDPPAAPPRQDREPAPNTPRRQTPRSTPPARPSAKPPPPVEAPVAVMPPRPAPGAFGVKPSGPPPPLPAPSAPSAPSAHPGPASPRPRPSAGVLAEAPLLPSRPPLSSEASSAPPVASEEHNAPVSSPEVPVSVSSEAATPSPPRPTTQTPALPPPQPPAYHGRTVTLPRQRGRQRLRLAITLGVVLSILAVSVAAAVFVFTERTPEARVEIISVPPGATVTFDGHEVPGVTPLFVADGLDATRSQEIIVTLPGYHPWESATDGQLQQMAVLNRLRATLQVTTEPRGAHIWVDHALYGAAPISVPNLDIGRQIEIEARKLGHDDTRETITITAADLEPTLLLRLPITPEP